MDAHLKHIDSNQIRRDMAACCDDITREIKELSSSLLTLKRKGEWEVIQHVLTLEALLIRFEGILISPECKTSAARLRLYQEFLKAHHDTKRLIGLFENS